MPHLLPSQSPSRRKVLQHLFECLFVESYCRFTMDMDQLEVTAVSFAAAGYLMP